MQKTVMLCVQCLQLTPSLCVRERCRACHDKHCIVAADVHKPPKEKVT